MRRHRLNHIDVASLVARDELGNLSARRFPEVVLQGEYILHESFDRSLESDLVGEGNLQLLCVVKKIDKSI